MLMNLIVVFLIRILEAFFVVGVLGCLLVLVLTLIEDAKTLLDKDSER